MAKRKRVKQKTINQLSLIIGRLEHWQNKNDSELDGFQSTINAIKSDLMRLEDKLQNENGNK